MLKGFEGLRLPALFGLLAETFITALAAAGGPGGVTRVALHADLLVKKPRISFLETCHIYPLA